MPHKLKSCKLFEIQVGKSKVGMKFRTPPKKVEPLVIPIHGTIVYLPTFMVDLIWDQLVGKYTYNRPMEKLVMG